MTIRKLLLAGALVAATTYGLCKLLDSELEDMGEKSLSELDIDFERFRKEHTVVDELNGGEIVEWMKAQDIPEGGICIVAYPTRNIQKEFGISGCPEELDPKSNLLQFVLDSEKGEMLSARLISFGSLSEKVRKLFSGKEYFVVIGNQTDE